MREFQQRRYLRIFFASRPVLIVLFFLLMGSGIMSFRALLEGMEVAAERRAVEEKLQKLEAERNALSSELEDLHSGRGIEREAREKLNYRKPGEKVVIIVDTNKSEPAKENSANASFWEALKRWLGFGS